MLQETLKQYLLTREEYIFFADDIIGEEFKRGYILTANEHNSNTDNYMLTFTYITAIHHHYDLFVKWGMDGVVVCADGEQPKKSVC